MRIHPYFTGGNIVVERTEGTNIFVERQLRDTVGDWFYWAFCVEGAAGQTLTFHFQKDRLGYYGPAVSYDLEHWHWLGNTSDNSFTYTFAAGENTVYFAHNMLYHPDRFMNFSKRMGIDVKQLLVSDKGRTVPFITFGDGEKNVILTARHHACESTGNYVLEGVLESLIKKTISGCHFFCVPFVDFDGVMEGDQGKNRNNHDHNRDYVQGESCVYKETAAIRKYADENGCYLGFDFHSPWHCRGESDKVLIPQKSVEKLPKLVKFGQILESCISPTALKYHQSDDIPPNVRWNTTDANGFAKYMMSLPGNDIAFTLETAYFGINENIFSEDKALELGRCFAAAIREYVK